MSCNLCGESDFERVTRRDRYGYAAVAVACRRCGLVFLNPVMTAAAYSQFYVDVYRPLVSAYHGRLIDAHTIQQEQRDYAAVLGGLLAGHVEKKGSGTLLDIGGSTGVVAHALTQRFGLRGVVLDPAPLEIDEARRLGLETVQGSVEDYDPRGRRFDVVTMCQTVDHLLDIGVTLGALRSFIAPRGIFFVDIVDFRRAWTRAGSLDRAIKVDHPYYLTESSMEAFLSRAGFRVVDRHDPGDRLHVGYVCRLADPDVNAFPARDIVNRLFDELSAPATAGRPT